MIENKGINGPCVNPDVSLETHPVYPMTRRKGTAVENADGPRMMGAPGLVGLETRETTNLTQPFFPVPCSLFPDPCPNPFPYSSKSAPQTRRAAAAPSS